MQEFMITNGEMEVLRTIQHKLHNQAKAMYRNACMYLYVCVRLYAPMNVCTYEGMQNMYL